MALVIKDRVKETTTTTGTGTYTLGGAVTGFETFTANLSNADTTYYACTDNTDFEVGLGTFTSSGTTLARTTILASSNSNNAVDWSSGTRTIFMTYPADKAVFQDASGNINGTFVGNITGNVTGNTSGTAATVTGAAQTNITSVGTLTSLTTSGDISVGDDLTVNGGQIDLRSDSGAVAKMKFYCEVSNAHAQTLQAQPHSAGSSAVLVLPTASGTLVGTGDTGSVSNTMLGGSIADSKLSTISTAGKVAISALDIDGGTDIGAALADSDEIIVDDGGGGTNRRADMSRVKTYIADVTLTTAAQTNITSLGTLTALTVDNVAINGTTIGHTDDTDLMTLADGALTVTGNLDVTGTLTSTGDFDVNTNKFNVTASSGNTAIAGTLDVTGTVTSTGNFDVNTNKFTVTASSGNTAIAGNLDVSGTVTSTGNFDVNTNKFNVIASSGNTSIAGTLDVTGEIDAASLDISGDADIDGTLEADAITVNGTALNTVIADEATALAIALG